MALWPDGVRVTLSPSESWRALFFCIFRGRTITF